MSKRDYYEVLGVNKNADAQEIKRAYRSLAKKYHPDVSTENDAEAKFKEVQEAYEVLSDSGKRSQYDQFGHQGVNGQGFGGFGGGQAGGFDFDFSDIFGSFFGGNQAQRSNRPRKGQDIQRSMKVSFFESLEGGSRKMKVQQHKTCHACHGSGAYSKDHVQSCSRCHGRGQIVVEQNTFFGRTQTQTVCPECRGTGKKVTKACDVCHGEGTETVVKTVDVKIPKGIDSGQQIRLEGLGNKGYNGGPSGDLYIVFDVEDHPLYQRHNDDIVLEQPINFVQATLGADIKVPTPHGDIKLNIPSGTQSGTTFRLKGKGMPNVRSKRLGDLHVVIKVVTPTHVDRKQKKLLEQLGQSDLNKKSKIWDTFTDALKFKRK